MLEFEPKNLNSINEELKKVIPVAKDYALKEPDVAHAILDNLRLHSIPFFEMTISDFHFVYQISQLCDEREYAELSDVFQKRMSSNLFQIGWVYCQINANESRAIQLFSIACEWMKNKKTNEYNKTLIGRTGLPWDDIYFRSVEIMRIENSSVIEFCNKYNIMADTVFFKQLTMTYFSRCDKAELLNNETQFAELIRTTPIDFLRPAIVNYTSKIGFENMPESIYEAILYRVSSEKRDDAFGLSPTMLQKIRQQRFDVILDKMDQENNKKELYKSISGRIRKIDLLNDNTYSIVFERYIVVDCRSWTGKAFAYQPNVYENLVETWQSKDYPDNFWPGVNENEVVNAHDVMLGIHKSGVILLEFNGFDALYTKDLLISTR